VVTYSVLAAFVGDLVRGEADVFTIVPDGQDPHGFEPSAKDVEALNNADLVVANGLDLEAGLDDALSRAAEAGTPVFRMSDHVTVAELSDVSDHSSHGHSHSGGDSGHSDELGKDPHLWLSPATLLEALPALTNAASEALGTDLSAASEALAAELREVDAELTVMFSDLQKCELVTGHNELGYFARRYGCNVIAAILPSASTSADESARAVEYVIDIVATHGVDVIFTSLGSSRAIAAQVAKETGVRLVEINTHFLGEAKSYADFIRALGTTIAEGLRS
jgi:zinc/manganese transport system substrate-binding protein